MSVLRLIPYEIKKLFSAFYIKAFIMLLLLSNILLCFFSSKDISIDSRFEDIPAMQEYVDKVYDLYHENPSFFLSEYERIMSEKGYSTQYGDEGYPDQTIFEIVYKVVCADKKKENCVGILSLP